MSDEQKTIHKNVYGVKLGSKYTVISDGNKERVEVTCVRRRPVTMEGAFRPTFSRDAEGYVDSYYPLKQGVPRNDRYMSIAESIRLTKAYVKWLLRDVPPESGIIFCLPLIKVKEGLEALKSSVIDACTKVKEDKDGNIIEREWTKAKHGLKFFSEARGAAFGTLPTEEVIGTNILVLNFGSSTIEVVFHAGAVEVEQNVYTFGGSEIDKRLMNRIMQEYRGTLCDEKSAREIKEQYSWVENNDVPKTLSLEGLKHPIVVSGDIIRDVVSNTMNQVVDLVRNQFLRAAEMRNPDAVSSLQSAGRGYLVLCGGMVNMEGFADELHERMIDRGVINEDIKVAVPEDGVTAPAIGAWKVGQVLETIRKRDGLDTWPEPQMDAST